MTKFGESLSTSNRMHKNVTWYEGDLVMDFVIFQGTRFDDATM